jgi:hypothetical protein
MFVRRKWDCRLGVVDRRCESLLAIERKPGTKQAGSAWPHQKDGKSSRALPQSSMRFHKMLDFPLFLMISADFQSLENKAFFRVIEGCRDSANQP